MNHITACDAITPFGSVRTNELNKYIHYWNGNVISLSFLFVLKCIISLEAFLSVVTLRSSLISRCFLRPLPNVLFSFSETNVDGHSAFHFSFCFLLCCPGCGWSHGDFFTAKDTSQLITWQDGRCSSPFLSSLPEPDSHLSVATGFGCATIFWYMKHRLAHSF